MCTCGWGLIRGPSISIILPYPSGLECQCLHCLPVGCCDPFHMNPKKEGVVNKLILLSRLFYFLIGGKLLYNVLLVSSGQQCKSVISKHNHLPLGLPWWLSGRESACQCRRCGFDACQEDFLEKEMETHFSSVAWEIPWTEEPGGPQSVGPQRLSQLTS